MRRHQQTSSRLRFERYRKTVRDRLKGKQTEENQDARASSEFVNRQSGRKRQRTAWQLIAEFLKLAGKHRGALFLALGTLTLATALGLIPPASTKFLVDYVLTGQPVPTSVWGGEYLPSDRKSLLVLITLVVLVVSLLKTVLHLWGRWAATRTTKRIQLSVRKRIFEHAIRLPLNRVHDLKSGGIASLLRDDGGSVGELVFGLIYNPWRAVIQLLGSLLILAFVDWKLLMGALLVLPAVYISHRTWIREIRPRYRDVRSRRQSLDANSTEAFSGMRVLRAFGRQRSETRRILTENHLLARQEIGVWWWSRWIEALWETLIPLATAALMLYGGWQVLEGGLSIGDLMMFLVYLLMLLEPLAVLAESAASFQNSLSGLDRVLDLVEEPREMPSTADSIQVRKEEISGSVRIDHVRFRYGDEGTWVIDDVSLDVQPGETIALVGPSGAGKTTLCNLVARFYDVTEGSISIDGTDLRKIDVESYRRLLGVVEQDVFLFDGTVEENIAYAVRDATAEEVRAAAQVANADEFIVKLPDGYDTIIGERGVKLSGGQRQRIAIARAVLADPKILILDEATSNLDTHSERVIQQSLRELMRNRTSFVIAHRLSTIRDADRIVVIDDGKVVEIGPHEELMERGERYRMLVEDQVRSLQVEGLGV